jgi:hypothetical protein
LLKQILALWPCPRSISATHANAVDLGLGLQGPGSGQRRLPESDSRLRTFINSASHAGFPNERGKEALSGTLKAEASEIQTDAGGAIRLDFREPACTASRPQLVGHHSLRPSDRPALLFAARAPQAATLPRRRAA